MASNGLINQSNSPLTSSKQLENHGLSKGNHPRTGVKPVSKYLQIATAIQDKSKGSFSHLAEGIAVSSIQQNNPWMKIDNILPQIIDKSQEGVRNLIQGLSEQSSKISPSSLLIKITHQGHNGIECLSEGLQNVEISEQTEEINDGQFGIDESHIPQNQENEVKQDDEEMSNQFISQQFGSKEKIESIKNSLENITTPQDQFQTNQTSLIDAAQYLEEYLSNKEQAHKQFAMAQIKQKRKENIHEEQWKNIARQQSFHSQRAKSRSGSRKGSEEQLNFDLTVKSKNSKNFNFPKQDSLVYSVQSDFGLRLESPEKNERQSKQENRDNQLEKIQDNCEEEQRRSIDQINSEKIVTDQQINKNFDKQDEKGKQGEQDEEGKQSEYRKQGKQGVQDEEGKQGEQRKQSKYQEAQKSIGQIKPETLIEKKNEGIDEKQENLSEHQERESEYYTPIKESIERDEKYEDQEEDTKKMMASVDLQKEQVQISSKKRVETQINSKKSQNFLKKNKKIFNRMPLPHSHSKVDSQSHSNIFSTQISNYQSKIAKIREAKEIKKKKLEEELAKVNHQIEDLKHKEEMSPHKNNQYASRLEIHKNSQAQKKAQKLVKNLKHQKRSRNMVKLGEFSSLDKNINSYMDELTKLRTENQEKLKQKKKIQILERMKQNEIRKLNQRKKVSQSQQFVLHLRVHDKVGLDQVSKRSPTKAIETESRQETHQIIITPELSNKKSYLNKVRNFSRKKSSRNIYEQALG